MKKVLCFVFATLMFVNSFFISVYAVFDDKDKDEGEITNEIVLIDYPEFVANFNSGIGCTFGHFSSFYNEKETDGYRSVLFGNQANGKQHLSARYSIDPNGNGDCPTDGYGYVRKEVFDYPSGMTLKDGATIKVVLKLEMDSIKNFNPEEGFGRTGFVLNVRDVDYYSYDNEFYYSICAYQGGTVITATGGNRNLLASQEVYSIYLDDLNPAEYHTYLFVYSIGVGIFVFVDDKQVGMFPEDAIGHRTDTNGYFYSDFVAFSLVNRSLNCHYSEETSAYEADSNIWVEKIAIYNGVKKKYTMISTEAESANLAVNSFNETAQSLVDFGVHETRIEKYPQAAFSEVDILTMIEHSSVFIYVGHAGYWGDSNVSVIEVNENMLNENQYLDSQEIYDSNADLSDTDLVILAGCNSASGTDTQSSLMWALKNKGVESVLGFVTKINKQDAYIFVKRFMYYYAKGFSCEGSKNWALYGTIHVDVPELELLNIYVNEDKQQEGDTDITQILIY